MTNEAIRVACAEACGWKTYEENPDCLIRHPDGGLVPPTLVPDYPNDLNACHEMEKTLRWNGKRDLTVEYTRCIYHIIDRESGEQFSDFVNDPVEIASVLIRATARQRCEAFLRTLGKWVEEGK